MLRLSDGELEIIMSHAEPLAQRGRFLEPVAAELNKLDRDLIGPGRVARVCRSVQRDHFDPPDFGHAPQQLLHKVKRKV